MIKMLDSFFLNDFYVEDQNKWSYGSQKVAKRGITHNLFKYSVSIQKVMHNLKEIQIPVKVCFLI